MSDKRIWPRATHFLSEWVTETESSPEPEWIIKNFVLPQGVTVISGPPTVAYKSWTIFSMGLAAASGKSVFGFEPGRPDGYKVWAIELESPARPTAKRFRAIEQGADVYLNDVRDNFYWSHISRHNFLNKKDLREVVAFIKQEGIEVVIIDTLAKAQDGNENSAESMSKFFQNIDALRAEGVGIVIVHHTNKPPEQQVGRREPDKAMRGSTAIAGAYDVHLSIDATANSKHVDWIVQSNEQEPMRFLAQWYFTPNFDGEGFAVKLDFKRIDMENGMVINTTEWAIDEMVPTIAYTQKELGRMWNFDSVDTKNMLRTLTEHGMVLERNGAYFLTEKGYE